MRRVLSTDRAGGLAEGGGGRRHDDAGDARSGRCPNSGLRAVHVDAEQDVRLGGAVGVDARDVIGERAAFHARGDAVLVEEVAPGHLRPASRDRRLHDVGAGEPHHLVAALEQPRGQRTPDEAARARNEDSSHG